MIQIENITFSEIMEDYNTVDKFKSDIVTKLNELENVWSSNFDYKPFISSDNGHSNLVNDGLDSLNIQDDRQIVDQYPFILFVK